MNSEDFEQQMHEEMQQLELDNSQDMEDDRMLSQQEFQESYGAPEPEERHNQHKFISDSLNFSEPEKVTYMSESELGNPLFTLRFLLDIEDICKYYLDDMCKGLNSPNKIALYFREKIINMSSSGMSNKGFIQNLNVTKKMEATRQRLRERESVKGGKFR